jgi:hypothetical protein
VRLNAAGPPQSWLRMLSVHLHCNQPPPIHAPPSSLLHSHPAPPPLLPSRYDQLLQEQQKAISTEEAPYTRDRAHLDRQVANAKLEMRRAEEYLDRAQRELARQEHYMAGYHGSRWVGFVMWGGTTGGGLGVLRDHNMSGYHNARWVGLVMCVEAQKGGRLLGDYNMAPPCGPSSCCASCSCPSSSSSC